MPAFTVGQFTDYSIHLLKGPAFLTSLAKGEEPRMDPRGFWAKIIDNVRDGSQAEYDECRKASQWLLETTRPLIGERHVAEIQEGLRSVVAGSANDLSPLRAYVNLLKAVGILPTEVIHVETGYGKFLQGALANPSLPNQHLVKYVGACRYLIAAQRFVGIEHEELMLYGAALAMDNWLQLIHENLTDTGLNVALNLRDEVVSLRDDHRAHVTNPRSLPGSRFDDFEEDRVAREAITVSRTDGKLSVTVEKRSFLANALQPFIRKNLLPPAGTSLEDLTKIYGKLNRVRRGKFEFVHLAKRAPIVVERRAPAPVVAAEVDEDFEAHGLTRVNVAPPTLKPPRPLPAFLGSSASLGEAGAEVVSEIEPLEDEVSPDSPQGRFLDIFKELDAINLGTEELSDDREGFNKLNGLITVFNHLIHEALGSQHHFHPTREAYLEACRQQVIERFENRAQNNLTVQEIFESYYHALFHESRFKQKPLAAAQSMIEAWEEFVQRMETTSVEVPVVAVSSSVERASPRPLVAVEPRPFGEAEAVIGPVAGTDVSFPEIRVIGDDETPTNK